MRSDVELPKRHDHDFYKTPSEFASLGLEFLWQQIARLDPFGQVPNAGWAPLVLDPGSGEGVWGTELRKFCLPRLLVGVELRETARPAAYDRWIVGDFLATALPSQSAGFDLVIGNPPYGRLGEHKAEKFIEHALALLAPGGFLLFLMKLTFLQSKRRAEGLFREHPPFAVAVCKKRPPFTGPGNTDSYAFMVFRKGYKGETRLEWV